MHLTLTATYACDDPTPTHLALSDDPSCVYAVEPTASGWRLDERDAEDLLRATSRSFELQASGRLTRVSVSPDGGRAALLVRNEGDGVIHLVDRARGEARAVAWGPSRSVRFCWSREGGLVAAGGASLTRVLDAETGEVLREHRDCTFDDWNNAFLLVHDEAEVSHFEYAPGTRCGRWEVPKPWRVERAILAADGGFWVACSLDDTFNGRDPQRRVRVSRHASNGDEVANLVVELGRPFHAAWEMGGALVLATELGVEGLVRFDVTARALRRHAPPEVSRPTIFGTVSVKEVSRDGTRFVARVGDVGGVECLVDMERGETRTLRDRPAGLITSLARSPDDRFLGATWRGGVATVFDAATLAPVWTFEDGHDWLEACAFTPDGRSLLTLSEGALRAWDLSCGEEVASARIDGLCNDTRPSPLDVWTLSVSPDGTIAFAFGRDEFDQDDVAITFDLSRFCVAAQCNPFDLPQRDAPPAEDRGWTVFTLAPNPELDEHLHLYELDVAGRFHHAPLRFSEAIWETDLRPTDHTCGQLTLDAAGDVAVFDPAPTEGGHDSPWLVRWNAREGSLRAALCAPGFSVSCDRDRLVRVEFDDDGAKHLVVRATSDLAVLVRYALGLLASPSEALFSRDGRVLYLGTQRGGVMRFELRDGDAPDADQSP
jgi:WD40 repeat protein